MPVHCNVPENITLASADLFNRFVCSVYIKSIKETVHSINFLSVLHFLVKIIQNYLANVPRSNKPAADGITPVLLNTISEHLAPFVYLLFTDITSTLSWLDTYLEMRLCNIYSQTGSRSDVQNYRPISILTRPLLIFEKLPFDMIYTKLRNKINFRQHDFQRGKVTDSQLIGVDR